MRYAAIWILFGAVLGGCGASTPLPAEQLASSQGAIRAAEAVGARRLPLGELHLQLAKEQVQQARGLIDEGENERARLVLKRAEADAELALVLAREHAAETEARQALQQVQAIQQRLQ